MDVRQPLEMLIDSFIAQPDAVEHHSITIAATPAAVYRAVRELDLTRLVIVRLLMAARGLPGFLMRRGARPGMLGPLTLDSLETLGFVVLAELPERELVLGVTGRFWRPVDNLAHFDQESYCEPVPPGFARAVWNFSVEERSGASLLSTETRVVCSDRSSRRKFGAYWLLVRPFSGLIRRSMLRQVKLTCEEAA